MTAGSTRGEDPAEVLHVNMLLCNKVQTLFHRTRLMGINPRSAAIQFYQRTVGTEHVRVIRSVTLKSPVKTPLPVTIVSKRLHYDEAKELYSYATDRDGCCVFTKRLSSDHWKEKKKQKTYWLRGPDFSENVLLNPSDDPARCQDFKFHE